MGRRPQSKKNKAMIGRAADYLLKEFKKRGFTVMKFDAITTNSVYLKLDEGVGGSIRISDHPGKKHLKYKYNLVVGSKLEKKMDGNIERYYFPMNQIELLVEKACYDKRMRVQQYGQESYDNFRKTNIEQGKKIKGFWSKAKYV